MISQILSSYKKLKAHKLSELDSNSFSSELHTIATLCNEYIKSLNKIDLISKVYNKKYFSFSSGTKISRPIRNDLFTLEFEIIDFFLISLKENEFSMITKDDIEKAIYSIAIGFCAIIDLEKVGDQKTPGTFFEYLIGYCFTKKLKITPKDSMEVLNLDKKTTLPTDYIFDLGSGMPKFHLPVKTSTRERVIQVWAHQRVLDGVYGVGRFWGTLVCLSETKLDHTKREVSEICLPSQWQVYQMFISQMKRVYYLDPPDRYLSLNNSFPKIHVKRFSEFFFEVDNINVFD